MYIYVYIYIYIIYIYIWYPPTRSTDKQRFGDHRVALKPHFAQFRAHFEHSGGSGSWSPRPRSWSWPALSFWSRHASATLNVAYLWRNALTMRPFSGLKRDQSVTTKKQKETPWERVDLRAREARPAGRRAKSSTPFSYSGTLQRWGAP